MLTDKQLKKLAPLTKHEKYGPILKAAITGWKRCRPVAETFGVDIRDGKFLRNNDKGCCFLGAVVLNRKYFGEGFVAFHVMKKFQLGSLADAWSLSDGFENNPIEYCKEAYTFGKKVRKALAI